MNIYSTCGTCSGEMLVAAGDAGFANLTHHPDCAPPKLPEADMLFEKFVALIKKLTDPKYKATSHDALNLGALQERIDKLDNEPPRLGPAAVLYAQWGWPVFPLKPRTKVPATPHGFKDATTDIDRIKAFWTKVPDANIGLPTGIHFDVIDVDLPDGPKEWRSIVEAGAVPDVFGQVKTSSNGRHFYVLKTGDGNSARIRPGIDYRGNGGYVVAPPSWLGDHVHRWSWITKPAPRIREVA